MGVTIVKPKATDVSKVDSAQVVPVETVDEFVALRAKVKKREETLKPLQTQVKKLELGIIGAVDEVIDPGTKFVLVGSTHELQLGAQGQRASVKDNEAVIDEIGIELFQKIAKVSITDLKAYCTPDQLEKITKSTFAIKRRIKVEKL